jgi:protein O-GlcNAc transferase
MTQNEITSKFITELYKALKEEPIKYNHIHELVTHLLRNSSNSDNLLGLAHELIDSNKIEAAISILKSIIANNPQDYNALNYYGVLLKKQNLLKEAESVLRRSTDISPSNVTALSNLGNTLLALNKPGEAIIFFDKAYQLSTENIELLRMKAECLMKMEKNLEASEILENALLLNTENVNIYISLSASYYNIKEYIKADHVISKALKKFPLNSDVLRTKAMTLKGLRKIHESVETFKKALEINPQDISAMTSLADTYYYLLADNLNASKYYSLAYKYAPNNVNLLNKICIFLRTIKVLDVEEGNSLSTAHQLMTKLLSLVTDKRPYVSCAQSIFLATFDYENFNNLEASHNIMEYWAQKKDNSAMQSRLSRVKTLEDRLKILNIHRIWGNSQENLSKQSPLIRKVRHRLDNKIRLGIMCSDLRNHPVAYFAWPLINYIDREKIDIYCYSRYPYNPCSIQKEFINKVDNFKVYPNENNKELAQHIADDQLDIALELGGLSSYSCVAACAYKPAPIQISWLGYPHSIGLSTIDYIMLDPYINPITPGLILEKAFEMPKTWVVIDNKIGFKNIEITPSLPEDRNGYITIGTLNMPHKITLESIEIWAQIMHSIPNSKFLYVRPETNSIICKNNFLKHMASFGIKEDRVLFGSTRTDHLPYYNMIDIAVDTFPHTGGTTTCEALWMGVPVVTLVGHSFFERISYSNLNNVMLPELCTFDTESYKETIIRLAENKEKRRYLRHNLRSQILKNPLGQPQEFAYDFCNKIQEVLGKSL